MKKKQKTYSFAHLLSAFLVGGLIVVAAGTVTQGESLQGKFRFIPSFEPKLSVDLDKEIDKAKMNQFNQFEIEDVELTRAEFSKMLVQSMDIETMSCDDFVDVPEDAWFNEYICTLANEGIIQAYQDGTIRPEATINRAEAAKIVHNAFDVEYACEIPQLHPDVESDQWYYSYVNELSIQEVFQGDTEFGEDFEPGEIMMRSSMETWMENI